MKIIRKTFVTSTQVAVSRLLCVFRKPLTLSAALLTVVGGSALAQEWTMDQDQLVEQPKSYSPFVDQHFPQQVFFGDTHFHSSLSVDSGMIGNTLDLDQAFRFATGEEVISSSGQRVKLIRPLDFLVMSDHAEYLGIADLLATANPELLATEAGRKWYDAMQTGGQTAIDATIHMVGDFGGGTPSFRDPKIERSVWDKVIETASRYNQPGVFTAFNGYEYSSSPSGNNLHRVVVFRDGPERVKQVLPFGSFDSVNPEDLWTYMAGYEEQTGGSVLAIPHNGNLSNGVMFAETVDGQPMTRDYAERRARWEPLMEVTQMKGDGEAHPLLSPDDQFADFETWDRSNINGVPKEDGMQQYEYARSALQNGIRLEETLGANPFKFGMIGSSDTHTSLSTTREDSFFSKGPFYEPSADRFKTVMLRNRQDNSPTFYVWQTSASGLVGAWARENSREAIFDAMQRKEVYATSGSRIRVRVFAGWEFTVDEAQSQFVELGYKMGVPMGGELKNAPDGTAPRLLISALRDPDNANLDRMQVIKGWLNADGTTEERIYDVACSDGRAIVERRCERDVGSTVEGASYTNTIGEPLMTAFWEDPDFDPSQRAFYYVRVLEIPKPRWTAYDVAYYGTKMPSEVPMTVQDRAYTSPIWYTPS